MLIHLTTLLPCMVSCLALLIFLTRFRKSQLYGYLSVMALLSALYFFCDACYTVTGVGWKTFILADILKQFAAPALALYTWYYLRCFRIHKRELVGAGYLIAIPAFMMAMGAVTYLIMGFQDAQIYLASYDAAGGFPTGFEEPIFRIHQILCRDLYTVVETGLCICLIAYMIYEMAKSDMPVPYPTSLKKTSIFNIQCVYLIIFLIIFCAKTVLGRHFFIQHPYIAMVLSSAVAVVMFLIGYTSLWGTRSGITLKDIFSAQNALSPDKPAKDLTNTNSEEKENNDVPSEETSPSPTESIDTKKKDLSSEENTPEKEEVDDYSEDEDLEEDEAEESFNIEGPIRYDEALVEKFKEKFIGEKMYLKNGLTIKDVCEAVASNKTYVSKMINERFGMAFPNFVNLMRIEYAKEYLLAHPDAKQEEIADECGFPNAAGFNRSFKKITGTTPRIWLAKNNKK